MNINEYFENFSNFENKIVVIAVKDDASRFADRISFKEKFGLQMNIKYRNSYIAVIDPKRDFVYENVSKESYECSYQVKRKFIDIRSAGYDTGNAASIMRGSREFAPNRRGFNVAVFHYRTLALVDRFFVDLSGDSNLTVKRS